MSKIFNTLYVAHHNNSYDENQMYTHILKKYKKSLKYIQNDSSFNIFSIFYKIDILFNGKINITRITTFPRNKSNNRIDLRKNIDRKTKLVTNLIDLNLKLLKFEILLKKI